MSNPTDAIKAGKQFRGQVPSKSVERRLAVQQASVEIASVITPQCHRYFMNFAAIGKPRMTQRDRWAKRDCVMAYRRWCDRLRGCIPNPPPAVSVRRVKIIGTYAPPESWSVKKRAAAIGQLKRTKPDWDNIGKSVSDALWDDDEAIPDARVVKQYGPFDRMTIEIEVMSERNGC